MNKQKFSSRTAYKIVALVALVGGFALFSYGRYVEQIAEEEGIRYVHETTAKITKERQDAEIARQDAEKARQNAEQVKQALAAAELQVQQQQAAAELQVHQQQLDVLLAEQQRLVEAQKKAMLEDRMREARAWAKFYTEKPECKDRPTMATFQKCSDEWMDAKTRFPSAFASQRAAAERAAVARAMALKANQIQIAGLNGGEQLKRLVAAFPYPDTVIFDSLKVSLDGVLLCGKLDFKSREGIMEREVFLSLAKSDSSIGLSRSLPPQCAASEEGFVPINVKGKHGRP